MTDTVDVFGDGRAVLYCGDCLEILPKLPAGSVDCVVTDPPYGVADCSGGDMRAFGKANYSGAFPDTVEYRRSVTVPYVCLCIERTKRVAVTPGIFGMWDYPPPEDVGCFWTPAAQCHGRWGFRTFNPILYYGRSPRRGIGDSPSGIALTEVAERNGHPCPKPIKAWRWLVEKTSLPGETVLDGMMGSGTTGVAAIQLGRRFIGIEIDPGYFQIALRRIREAEPLFSQAPQAEPTLFEEEPHA